MGNETSGQKATLLLSPRDCVTARDPTFMTLQMILEDQFLFKTYIHTYAGTLYHVLCSEKVLKVIKAWDGRVTFVNTKHSPQPKHVNKLSEVNSVNSQQAAAGPSWTVNTEPFHSPQQAGAQQLQLALTKYQQGIYITIAVPTALNTPPPITIMFPTFSFPSIHTLIKKERSHKYIMEKNLVMPVINAETYPAF